MLRKLYRSWRADRVLWIAGVLALVLLVLLQGQPHFTNASRPSGWGGSQLALQFAPDAEEVERILSDAPSADREVMRFKTYLDFAFIAAYATLAILLGRRTARSHLRLGWTLAACAAATVLFDVLENRAILEVVNSPLQFTTPDMLASIRRNALVKWTLTAVTLTAFAAAAFRNRSNP